MLNIVKWFKPGASARQKEISAAEHLAEVEARIDRLNDEAGNLYLDGSGNDRRLGEIEVELRDLVARRGWLQRARLRAAAQAAADEAAAEAERRRQETEAKERLIAELVERYLGPGGAVERIAATRQAHLQALSGAATVGAELGVAIGTAESRRLLGARAIAYRYRATGWRATRDWYPYEMGVVAEARRELGELEPEIIAELRRPAVENGAPDDPAGVSAAVDEPQPADNEPEAA